jgi:hypothetical protein
MKLKNAFNKLCTLAILTACAFSTNLLATDVFTWTDENGVVHYSDLPSDTAEAKEISVEGVYKPGTVESSSPSPAGSESTEESPATAAQQRRERIASEHEERREKQAETEQMCVRHKQRLEQMEPARRVMYQGESGEMVRMDDDQRMKLIDESRNFITKNCE